jgi:hypothetical protein
MIKFLIYNQFQILNLISFIIRYMCPKKGHSTKMGIVIQKVNQLNVHSPCKITCTHLVGYYTFFGYFFYHFHFIPYMLGSPIRILQFEL